MKKSPKQMFDCIMGDCCGIDMQTLTRDDIVATAKQWDEEAIMYPQWDGEGNNTDLITEEEIELAYRGLLEYQADEASHKKLEDEKGRE